MEKVRIGNDMRVNFSVYRNGVPESFDGASNIVTKLVNEAYNKLITHTYTITNNIVQFDIDALQLTQCGKCRLFISYTKGGDYTVDSPAFELVNYTDQTGGTEIIGVEIVSINISGDIGINRDGLSAYEVWESYPGNEGKTIEQYFAWLRENPTKIDLNGLNSNIDKLHFNPDTLVQLANVGDVRYSQESRTLEVKVSDTVSIQLGQEMQTRIKNDEAIQINNGQMVYINSAVGANPLAKIASTSNADIAQRTFGMATENIPANGFGAITTEGLVRDINTSAFPEGAMLWLGANGGVTNIEPTAPISKISVGMVLRSNANNGIVYVKIRAIARNQKLSDVYAPTLTGGDVLRWNNTTLRFEAFNITSALGSKVDTSRTINAGNGLTGGGNLTEDRTININPADDSLTVTADNIKVNTNNTLTSTSTTQPLSANQGKVLNEKVVQVETDLNEKSIELKMDIDSANERIDGLLYPYQDFGYCSMGTYFAKTTVLVNKFGAIFKVPKGSSYIKIDSTASVRATLLSDFINENDLTDMSMVVDEMYNKTIVELNSSVTYVLISIDKIYAEHVKIEFDIEPIVNTIDKHDEYIDNLYENVLQINQAIPSLEQSHLIKTTGSIEASELKTYYYSVEEGDLVKILINVFSSPGFSVISLWNNTVFVDSIENSPSYPKECKFIVPAGVNRVACSYFNDNVYIGKANHKSADALDAGTIVVQKPNLLPCQMVSQVYNGVTFTVQSDKSVLVSGTSTALATRFYGKITLTKGQYWLGGNNNPNTNCRLRIVATNSAYRFSNDKNYVDPYIEDDAYFWFEVLNESEEFSLYIYCKSNFTVPNWLFKPMIYKVGTPISSYVQYGENYILGNIGNLVSNSIPYVGKKICGKGDSIMAGSGGNFLNEVARVLGVSFIKNYGIGGSRMAYYGDGGGVTADMSVVATWDDMDADADIIIIHAGTNDWATQVPLGNSDSTDMLEFNGALNIIMSGMRQKYPTALIVFNTILPRVDYDAATHGGNPTPIKTSDYSNAIKERCKYHHMLCNDIYESCGFDFVYDYSQGIYATTNDGLHPNETGARILGRKIAGFIMKN